ncbi:MAG: hypothetical protein J7647_18380 [Cyanobacteria bacterium SBLK]|nr:hypothetical protein [Cyanobacteria bacterium SBLK]
MEKGKIRPKQQTERLGRSYATMGKAIDGWQQFLGQPGLGKPPKRDRIGLCIAKHLKEEKNKFYESWRSRPS